MTTLDIDMGNTRTKWRCGTESGALPAPRLPTPAVRPSRVRVATVLRNRDAVADAVREGFGVAAEFAQVRRRLDGLVCGYRKPADLGVDRWLATLAAWRDVRAALIVVGAGTACTVDFVAPNGRHEGGYIAPGLGLLRGALAQRTADIRIGRRGNEPASGPGRSTTSAVNAGTMTMLLGYVEAAIADFRARHNASVFVTGGDAPRLAAALAASVRHVPTLVLDGLAIAMP